MRNFVKELVTNRFGIVLATLNVCFFASAAAASPIKMFFPRSHFAELMLVINSPATILTGVSLKAVEFLFSMGNIFSYRNLLFTVFVFFITLQWLFIAWTARKIAQRWAGK